MNMETVRFPVTGSCHCGKNRYVAWLTLPKDPDAEYPDKPPTNISRTYKCNCTMCYKANHFHVRLVDSPHDFILLKSPDNDQPLANLSDYQCNSKMSHWYFCKNCGDRVFIVFGKGEFAEVDVDKFKGHHASGNKERVWRLHKQGWEEGVNSYFSLNGVTIDRESSDLDLRKLHERGWLRYVDEWKDVGGWSKKPHEGGFY